MKSILTLYIFSLSIFTAIAQNVPLNQPAIGYNATSDAFTYNGKSVGHYSLGWYIEQGQPPISYLAGYDGVKLFTQGQPRLFVNGVGRVGIGTIIPNSQLEIKGLPEFDSSTMLRLTNNAAQYGRTNLVLTGRIQEGNDAWQFGTNARNSIVFSENAAAANQQIGEIGEEKFSIQLEGNSNALGFLSRQNGNTPNMIMFPNGNISIGTNDHKGYKLAVAGSLISESVTVKLQSQWPDYVFKPTYNLPSLTTVKAYIDKNKHLPDMPSEAEVAKNGVNLGEIVKLQTKKIEELTLYLIERDNQYKALLQRLKKLEVSSGKNSKIKTSK